MSQDTRWFQDRQSRYEEMVAERCYWRRLGIIAVLSALVVYALIGAGKALADDAYRAPDGKAAYVRHEAACTDADIIAHLTRMGAAHLLEKFKKGTLTYGGRDWRSCWIEIDGMVYSVDEEGEPLQPLPVSLFKVEGV